MTTPRSVRFEDDTLDRLAAFASRRPGLTSAAAAARLVEEGLRMDAHPRVIFRDGPAGRRATLIGGPDVWEVVKAIRDVRAAGPKLKADSVLRRVQENAGIERSCIDAALAYYGAYPQEIDERLVQESVLEAELVTALRNRDQLLGA